MNYDALTVNFFPAIGLMFMLVFMWFNKNMEKKVILKFYIIAAIIAVELVIFNVELLLTAPGSNTTLLTLATASGYALRPFLLYLFIDVLIRDITKRRFRVILLIPAMINVLFAFSTFFTHMTYWYDENNVLCRGPFGWMTHIIMAVYLLSMLIMTFVNRGKNNTLERIIIVEIAVILMFSALAESLLGNNAVLRISMTSSLIFYYMYFQTQVYQNELINKHKQQTEMTEKLNLQIITALASTVDAKDSYTNGHSQRVAIYAREIAVRMGKSKEFQKEIYYMGLLHDIGKIGIPDSIINKPGRLTDEEFAVIKSHPVIGADVLLRITAMPNLYVGAMWHHERYDGRGYPDGLSGDDIPIYARIIAVADTYDAMTSRRSYRSAMTQEKVRNELEHAKRTQLDPFIVNIMLEMMSEDVNYEMRDLKSNDAPLASLNTVNNNETAAEKPKDEPPPEEKKPVAANFFIPETPAEPVVPRRGSNYVSPEQLAAAQLEALRSIMDRPIPDPRNFTNEKVEEIEQARISEEEQRAKEEALQDKRKGFAPFNKKK